MDKHKGVWGSYIAYQPRPLHVSIAQEFAHVGVHYCTESKKTYALYSDHSGSESHARRGFCLYINWSHNCHRIADKLRIQDQKQYHYDLHISASITFCSFGVLWFWLVSWLLLLCVYHHQASKGIKHTNVSSIAFCLPMRPQPETYPRPIAMQSLSVTDVHIMVRFAIAINTWKYLNICFLRVQNIGQEQKKSIIISIRKRPRKTALEITWFVFPWHVPRIPTIYIQYDLCKDISTPMKFPNW